MPRPVRTLVGAHLEVLADAHAREQPAPFGGLGDPHLDDVVRRLRGDLAALEADRAAPRPVQAVDRAERRRLAGAVGPDQRDDLALAHLQRDTLDRVDGAVVGVDVVHIEDQRLAVAATGGRPARLGSRGGLGLAAGLAHADDRLRAQVRLDHARILLHLFRRALGDLLAVVEHGHALGDAHHHLHVVLDEEHRQPELVPETSHERGEVGASPAGSCRPWARPGAAASARWRARARPRAAAGRRRRGSSRSCRGPARDRST